MLTRLLRTLPYFRDLYIRTMEAEDRYIKSQDECRIWQARAEAAESDRDRSRMSEIAALKSLSNWQALQMGSLGVPFADVNVDSHQIAESKPPIPQRRLASDVRAEYVARARMAARLPRPEPVATNDSVA